MPFFSLTTSQSLSPETEDDIISEACDAVKDVLGKPEEFLISLVNANRSVRFGRGAEPAAWIEFKALGLPVDAIPKLAERFAGSVSRLTGVPEDRIYTVCEDVPRTHWAKGPNTFG